jgi:predicted Zn-dependent protease
MTESEEYFVGRAVAADVVDRHAYVEDPVLQDYINRVGYTLAFSSRRPLLYGGYHFALIQSDEINAFAAPGGFVFLTTGALRAMHNEEELAGVLAHEIAHVVLRHPDRAAQAARSRRQTAEVVSVIAAVASETDAGEWAELLGGVTNEVLLDLWEKGYSREWEYAADDEAVRILQAAGYDPAGLREFLERLPRVSHGFSWGGSTHPDPRARAARIHVPPSQRVKSDEFLAMRGRLGP